MKRASLVALLLLLSLFLLACAPWVLHPPQETTAEGETTVAEETTGEVTTGEETTEEETTEEVTSAEETTEEETTEVYTGFPNEGEPGGTKRYECRREIYEF